MLLRTIFVVLTLAIVASSTVACGGGQSAEDAVRERIQQDSAGEYDKVWESLHPAQQAIVPEDLFVRCGQESAQKRDPVVDRVDVTDVKSSTMDIPAVGSVKVKSVSVTLYRGDNVTPRIWSMVKVDGSWRWVLASEPLEKFRNGQCP